MDNSIYKKCEVCGQEKHISEFSKSYRNRCKACVAEHTREVRAAGKHTTYEFEKGIDWEQRRYEIAKEMLPAVKDIKRYDDNGNLRKLSMNEAAYEAVKYADALIAELKKGGENE